MPPPVIQNLVNQLYMIIKHIGGNQFGIETHVYIPISNDKALKVERPSLGLKMTCLLKILSKSVIK